VGDSAALRQVFSVLDRVSQSDVPVQIAGASGTGKELVARAIHYNGARKDKPWIAINCSSIPETLIESELFGHKRGAFTNALADKQGRFGLAHQGTLFLDEIGDMSLRTQAKILRILQEQRFEPIGSTETVSVDVRVIAATNQKLSQAVAEGRFRDDLYYRLNVILVEMPPLRDRAEDVPLIAQRFLQRFAGEMGKEISGFDVDAMSALVGYPFPGNVRELENVVERAVTFETSDSIRAMNLPPQIMGTSPNERAMKTLGTLPHGGVDLEDVMATIEKNLLGEALERTRGNRTEAAKLLGISFRSIRYKLDKYGMKTEDG